MKQFNNYLFLLVLIIVFGLLVSCNTTETITQKKVKLKLEEIKNSHFITGMQGAENLCLDQQSLSVYVSDIAGYITYLDGNSYNDLKIIKRVKKGKMIFGLAKSADNYIYAGISNYDVEGWRENGGSIYRLSSNLEEYVKITSEYPGINGIAIDNNSNLYFSSSNFDFISPKGNIYRIKINDHENKPSIYIENVGLANGLYFDPLSNNILYSDTITGIYSFTFDNPKLKKVFEINRFWGAIDDLGVDSNGRIWMTDPGNSTFQCFDPNSNTLISFFVKGIGETSSCRIRKENNEDILYVSELNFKGNNYDGRGVFIIPVKSLDHYIN